MHISRWHYERVRAHGAVFQSVFLKHVKYFILSCNVCKLLWSIVDSCLYLTLCDCSTSCFDPVYLLLAYLWLGLSRIGCISTINYFPHQKQAAGTLHQQQAAREAQQKHSAENTIKLCLDTSGCSYNQQHRPKTNCPVLVSTRHHRVSAIESLRATLATLTSLQLWTLPYRSMILSISVQESP